MNSDVEIMAKAIYEEQWKGFAEDSIEYLQPLTEDLSEQWRDAYETCDLNNWRSRELMENLAALSKGAAMCSAIRVLRASQRCPHCGAVL